MTEEAIIAGIKRSDDAAIVHFVKVYEQGIYGHCLRILRQREEAEEACQDIFLKALRSIDRFESRSSLRTWLYRITYTTCLDRLKKTKRKTEHSKEIDPSLLPSWTGIKNAVQMMVESERQDLVEKAIRKLKETDSLLIHLYYMEELSMEEIAQISGLSRDNVKIRIHRARKKLAAILTNELPKSLIKSYIHV